MDYFVRIPPYDLGSGAFHCASLSLACWYPRPVGGNLISGDDREIGDAIEIAEEHKLPKGFIGVGSRLIKTADPVHAMRNAKPVR